MSIPLVVSWYILGHRGGNGLRVKGFPTQDHIPLRHIEVYDMLGRKSSLNKEGATKVLLHSGQNYIFLKPRKILGTKVLNNEIWWWNRSQVTQIGNVSSELYSDDLVLMAPQQWRILVDVAEWRVSLVVKGLKVNAGIIIIVSSNLCLPSLHAFLCYIVETVEVIQ